MNIDMNELFGEPIHVYTREQAVADGEIVDATKGEYAEVTTQHWGQAPVMLTRSLHALITKAVENKNHCNDFKGVWHDIMYMGRGAAANTIKDFRSTNTPSMFGFQVIITGAGRKRNHVVFAAFDGEALTFGFQEDF